MTKVKVSLLAVLGVCLLGASLVSSATAQQFHASTTGNLKGAALTNQNFTTSPGGPEVICTKASSSGKANVKLTLLQLIQVKYEGCHVLTFFEVNITVADYLFSADKSLVILDNTIKIEVPVAGCSVTVFPQHLTGVTYVNTNKKLEEKSNVNSIKSTGTGGTCGTGGNSGTYTGNNLLELEGGTLEWF